VPLRIFKSRLLSGANAIIFLLGAAMFGMWFLVSLYLQQVLGYSPLKAGLAFLPMPVMIAIGSTVASRMVARVGFKPLLVVGMVAQAVGLLLFAGITPDGTYLGDVLAPALIVATGMGLAFVPATIAAVAGVAPNEAGLAGGLVNTARQMGGSLGLALLATVATEHATSLEHSGSSVDAALTAGYSKAFEVASGFAIAGAVVALLVLHRRRQTAPAPVLAES
jgi:predicted MFS family arabinose efflux permease